MSEPTYRIALTYDASTDTEYVWDWHVYALADDRYSAGNGSEKDKETAKAKALDCIVRLGQAQQGETLYATEDGEIVPAPEPQSLRA